MPSLDGYSLNEKMDSLHSDIEHQIEQLGVDFQGLYDMLKNMKSDVEEIKEHKCQEKISVAKSKTQKKKVIA
tara:strand:- start:86 stop:301 length:216 start_codon:yes stop_codon:yes gene_type:complete